MRASLTWAIASIPWLEHYHHHTNDFKLSQLASLLSPNESVCLLSAAATTRTSELTVCPTELRSLV